MPSNKVKWVAPSALVTPHRETHPDKTEELALSMCVDGWLGEPLVGYWFADRIQLVNGTHRTLAAILGGLEAIPVRVYNYEEVEKVWGTPEWAALLKGEL